MRFGIFPVMVGRRAGGPETYEINLVRSLAALDRSHEIHVFCLSRHAIEAFGSPQENVQYHLLRPGVRWISIAAALPVKLLASGLTLFHATFVPPPISPTPYVFTLHDLTNFQNPEFYNPFVRWRLDQAIAVGLKKARLILCVSDCVRNIVQDVFKISPERLKVVHHGVAESFRPVSLDEARRTLWEGYGIKRRYLLFVGQMKARKNIIRILQAFHQFRNEAKSNCALLLVGRKDHTAQGIDEEIARLQLHNDVVQLGHVKPEDLPALYSAAEMLVFPSLFEGFGFPVIEAMACNTPVITSDVSALPEVAQNCALLVDPLSVEDIAAAIYRLYSDVALRHSLQQRGLARAKQFTWARTARETLQAYQQVSPLGEA